MRSLIIFFICLLSIEVNAQLVSGSVKDDKGSPLPGCTVFISNSQKVAITNDVGQFSIKNIPPGKYSIVAKMIGFNTLSKELIIEKSDVSINFILVENTVELQAVIIKPDPDRPLYLEYFKRYFIGNGKNALQTKIVNPRVLNLHYNKGDRILTANSTDFLVIENSALGYKIKLLLTTFEIDINKGWQYYEAETLFEEMEGSAAKKKGWIKNRKFAYTGSSMHYLRSLFNNSTEQEGFYSFRLIKKPNPSRPPEALIQEKFAYWQTRLVDSQGSIDRITQDSLTYWQKKYRLDKETSYLINKPIKVDTLLSSYSDDFKVFKFSDYLYIIYNKDSTPDDLPDTTKTTTTISPKKIEEQASILQLQTEHAIINKQGISVDPKALFISGQWAKEKAADLLPIDYIP